MSLVLNLMSNLFLSLEGLHHRVRQGSINVIHLIFSVIFLFLVEYQQVSQPVNQENLVIVRTHSVSNCKKYILAVIELG